MIFGDGNQCNVGRFSIGTLGGGGNYRPDIGKGDRDHAGSAKAVV
jgi:hypothetical protein